MEAAKMKEIVQALFPVHRIRTDAVDEEVNTDECPFFTVKELEEAVCP